MKKNSLNFLRVPARIATTLLLAGGLGACASSGGNPQDPWESMNRATFRFNDVADRAVMIMLGAQWVHEPAAPHTILGTAQLQLPIFDHGEREQADYLASAERLRGAAADARTAGQTELLAALHELEHSREIWTHLNTSILPAITANLQLRERLLQAGEGTVLEVLLVRRSLAATRGRAARAQAVHSFSRYKLWLYLQQLGLGDAAADSSRAVTVRSGSEGT